MKKENFWNDVIKNENKIKEILNSEENKILVYHRDADGVCSAALILKYFPNFKSIVREGPIIDKDFYKKVIKEKPKFILFVDIPIDQSWKKLKEIKNKTNAEILIIDHHIPEKNLNPEGIIHINPLFYEKIYLPASFLVYEIVKKFEKEIRRFVWIAGIGIIGDHCITPECLEECKKFYPNLLNKKPLNSKLAKGAELISSAISLKGETGAEKALEILIDSQEFEDFFNQPKLRKWKEIINKEIKKILMDFEIKKETYPEINLFIYLFKSKFNLSAVISSILADKYPDKIILIAKELNGDKKVSIRYSKGKLNMGEIVKQAVKGIGSGGGHPQAAGALIKDWKKFKENLIKIISSSLQ